MARSITLVRHGRTAYNAASRIQGWVDIPLDATGRWQAVQTGDALAQLYGPFADGPQPLVVSSDLGRAHETAQAFAAPLGLAVSCDERFRERHFGEWEGLSMQELRERYPEDYALWERHAGGELNHGAETRQACGRRGVDGLLDWASRTDGDLFVFSHGALICNLVQVLLHVDDPAMEALPSMRNAHWARLQPAASGEDGRFTLIDYNHGPALADTPQWGMER